jgi:hypothetical protein
MSGGRQSEIESNITALALTGNLFERVVCAAGGLNINYTEATPKLGVLDSTFKFNLRLSL